MDNSIWDYANDDDHRPYERQLGDDQREEEENANADGIDVYDATGHGEQYQEEEVNDNNDEDGDELVVVYNVTGQQLRYHIAQATMEVDVEGNATSNCSNDGPQNTLVSTNTRSKEGHYYFDCHICMDVAQDPVVTCCGHLFCWPCLSRWLDNRATTPCPVCKHHLHPIVPLYGRGKPYSPYNILGDQCPPRPRPPLLPRPSSSSLSSSTTSQPLDSFNHDPFSSSSYPSHFNVDIDLVDSPHRSITTSPTPSSSTFSASSLIASFRPLSFPMDEENETLLTKLYVAFVCLIITLIIFM